MSYKFKTDVRYIKIIQFKEYSVVQKLLQTSNLLNYTFRHPRVTQIELFFFGSLIFY